MAMPPGPPGPPEQAEPGEGQDMPPDQAMQILSQLGIKPDMIPTVMAACEAVMEPQGGGGQGGGPPQQVPQGGGQGLMAALNKPFRGG